MSKSVPPFVGVGMVVRKVIARTQDVVFLKGIVEAHDGLAQVFAEHGGELTLAAPIDRARELDAFVADMCREIGLIAIGDAAEPV